MANPGSRGPASESVTSFRWLSTPGTRPRRSPISSTFRSHKSTRHSRTTTPIRGDPGCRTGEPRCLRGARRRGPGTEGNGSIGPRRAPRNSYWTNTRVGFRRETRERGAVGEGTIDDPLLEWCNEHGYAIVTNDLKDFKPLGERRDRHGILAYADQELPDRDPEGLARTVVTVIEQYVADGVENAFVDLGEWYDWLHR